MTKSLLFSAALLLSIGANAQYYTITQDRAPKDGDAFNQVYDTLPTITKGNAGVGQSWDFNSINLHQDDNATWQNAANTANGSSFPDAELELNDSYFNLNGNRLELVGVMFGLTGTPQPIHFSNPETILSFPSTYQSSYTDTGSYRASFFVGQNFGGVQIDSVRITSTTRKSVSFDATGTMATPFGTFKDCIRERNRAISTTKNEIYIILGPGFGQWVDASTLDPSFAGTNDTTVTYSWYNNQSTSPVATLTYDATDSNPVLASVNSDPELTGIAKVSKASGSIFPNPASNVVYIKGGDVTAVTVSDIQGRVILSDNNFSGTRFDVSALSAGNYVMTITGQSGVRAEQLNIVK
ncbi:MAG: T9SS type A sorting domain-containing protein [Bacteroidota bacterium]